MTYNQLIGAIAKKTRELADMKMPQLRREHPDSQSSDVGAPPPHVMKMGRGELMEDILNEEFDDEFDFDLTDDTELNETQSARSS